MKLGIFIGRMQPLHLGHQKDIKKSLDENDLTFIILGSSGKQGDNKNIFSDKQREKLLKIFLKKKTRNKILFLKDNSSDKQWIKNLNSLIIETGEDYLQATLKRLLGGSTLNSEDIQTSSHFFLESLEKVTFYCGDLKNDYAIKVIKEYEELLDYKKIMYSEIDRKELIVNNSDEKLFISSTRIREELKNKNIKLLEKMLDKRILKEIKKIYYK